MFFGMNSEKRKEMKFCKIGDVVEITKSTIEELKLSFFPGIDKWRKGLYVVESVGMDGGGTGHGPHDVYPDGWCVQARRLKDSKYDEKGRVIEFYQSGCFSNLLKNVSIVGKMKRTFVWPGSLR